MKNSGIDRYFSWVWLGMKNLDKNEKNNAIQFLYKTFIKKNVY